MRNDQTPVEGKGGEMIPERGLPFDEESQEEEISAFEFQDYAEPENIEDVLGQVPNEISQEARDQAETEGNDEESPPEEFSHIPENFLDIEEIRGREMELSVDSHTTAPDFEGEPDMDFAAARTPVSLASADREAIMLESGAGILEREALVDQVSQESFELPGPVSAGEEVRAPETTGDLKATKKMLDLLVTDKTVEMLWNRADDLQAAVIENIEDLTVARSLLEHIRNARTRLLEKKDNYEEAERALNEVEFRLSYNQRSHQWRGLGYGILAYEVIWGIALLIGTGLLLFGGENSLRVQESGLISRAEVFIGLGGMLWGGMGGVVGALHALWRYITSQKFTPQYNIWYLSQPIMGVFIGAFVFLFIKIGFSVTAGSTAVEIGSPWMVYLLGFIAGFQQNVLYDIIKQVLKLFKLGSDAGKPANEDTVG